MSTPAQAPAPAPPPAVAAPRAVGPAPATTPRGGLPSVWLVDTRECETYEQFLARRRDSELYHTLVWRDVLIEDRGGQPCYLAAMREDRIVGVLPMFEQSDVWNRRRLLSLPATPSAGLIADDERVAAALLDRAANLAVSRGAASLTFRCFERSSSPTQPAVPDWVRVRPRDLAQYCRTNPPAALTCRDAPVSEQVLDLLNRGRRHGPSSPTNAMLRGLAARGAALHATLAFGGDDHPVSAAVWIMHQRCVHVLGCAAVPGEPTTCRSLIPGLLEAARLAEAAWIDLPMPRRADAWFESLTQLDGARVPVERRITPSTMTSRRPAN